MLFHLNQNIWAEADWIIDIGPEGGTDGGQVVAEGPPAQLARSRKTHTGRLLAEFLAAHRGERPEKPQKPEGPEGKAAESKASERKANLAGLRPASRARKASPSHAGTKTHKTDPH